MNVLWICAFNDSVLGSFGDHLLGMAQQLNSMGGQLICAVPGDNFAWKSSLTSRGVRVVDYSQGIPSLLLQLQGLHISIVHSHYNPSNMTAACIALLKRVPHVVHWHAAPPTNEAQFKRFVKKQLFRIPDVHVAVSHYVADCIHQTYGPSQAKILVQHNGIDLDKFSSAPQPMGRPIVAAVVANFRPEKDHQTLVSALTTLTDLPLRVVMVGDGPTRPEIEQAVVSYGLKDRVTFTGKVHDVASIISQSHFVILPTKNEAFGLSVLEGMAMGRPAIAANVGGLPEFVIPEQNGLLYAAASDKSLAAAIRRIVLDDDFRSQLCEGAKATAVSFSVKKWADTMLGVYSKSLSRFARDCRLRGKHQPFAGNRND